MDTTLIALGSGSIVCLIPLAIYFLYLAKLNSRPRPTLVHGSWDFAALLLGLGGFVLLAGPVLITLVHSTWRRYAFGGWADLRSVTRTEAIGGSLMAGGYFVMLLGLIPLLLRTRRHVTAIYHVDPTRLPDALVQAAADLGYEARQAGVEIVINDPCRQRSATTVRIDIFPSTSHVTLSWSGPWETIRSGLEARLAERIALSVPARNPVAGWLFTAGIAVMIVMLLWLVVLLLLILTPPPR